MWSEQIRHLSRIMSLYEAKSYPIMEIIWILFGLQYVWHSNSKFGSHLITKAKPLLILFAGNITILVGILYSAIQHSVWIWDCMRYSRIFILTLANETNRIHQWQFSQVNSLIINSGTRQNALILYTGRIYLIVFKPDYLATSIQYYNYVYRHGSHNYYNTSTSTSVIITLKYHILTSLWLKLDPIFL